MGEDRNGDNASAPKRHEDNRVCRFFLLNMCPHDLFVNTKSDLGPCTKKHSKGMQVQYEKECKEQKTGKISLKPSFDLILFAFAQTLATRIS